MPLKNFLATLISTVNRELKTGAASYMLAVDCYSYRNKKVAPTFKIALSSLRAAWLFNDLAKENPEAPFGKIAVFFYKKAYQSYVKADRYNADGRRAG